MQLIGLDVGFAETGATSGVAALADGVVGVGRATAAAADRMRLLRGITRATVVAIDAPLLPEMNYTVRTCERLLSRGAFQWRCKPGFSHVKGTGRQLRQAGMGTASQLRGLASEELLPTRFPRVFPAHNIVEAFPNAFLGVCLEASTYEATPAIRRGKKFDWLYEEWCGAGRFARRGRDFTRFARGLRFQVRAKQPARRTRGVGLHVNGRVCGHRPVHRRRRAQQRLHLPSALVALVGMGPRAACDPAESGPVGRVWIDGVIYNGADLPHKR